MKIWKWRLCRKPTNREILEAILRNTVLLREGVEKMAETVQQESDDIVQLKATLDSAVTDIEKKIADLTTQLQNATLTDEQQAALDALKASVASVRGIVPAAS